MARYVNIILAVCLWYFVPGHCADISSTGLGSGFTYTFAIPPLRYTINPQVLLTTSAESYVHVTVRIPAVDFIVNVTITQNEHSVITLPNSAYITGNGTHHNTVIVHASQPITVHVIDNDYRDGDGYTILSDSSLGCVYYILSYQPYHSSYPSFFTISATTDNTTVDISTVKGVHLQINIDALDTYQLLGSPYEDLTGTRIKSNNPVSVISGARLTQIPKGVTGADGIVEQLLPVAKWGRRHILAPFMGRTSGYIYRVMGSNLTTTLDISHVGIVVINEWEWFEGDITDDTMVSIVADNPVSVMQYMKSYYADNPTNGDPSMLVVPAVETYTSNVTFPVYQYKSYPSMSYYITIIIECESIEGLTLDNEVMNWNFLQTDDGTMCAVRGAVPYGLHHVGHQDHEARFTVAVHGLYVGSSFAYPASLSNDYVVSPTSQPTRAPVSRQPTSTREPGPVQEIPEMTLICEGTNMTAIFNASVIPYNQPSDVHLWDPDCVALEYGETQAIISTNYDMCHTQTMVSADHVVYSNALVLGDDDLKSPIMPFAVSFECRLDRRHRADTSYQSTLKKHVSYGNFTYDLVIYEDETYVTPYIEYPVDVRVGDTLYLAGMVVNLNKFALFLDSCWATPSADPWDDASYTLISDGCAEDETMTFHDSGDPSVQQFSFRAFAFRDGNWLVYVHCQMLVCDDDDPTSRCAQGCTEVTEFAESRMRRSISDLKMVSSGPLVVRGKKE